MAFNRYDESTCLRFLLYTSSNIPEIAKPKIENISQFEREFYKEEKHKCLFTTNIFILSTVSIYVCTMEKKYQWSSKVMVLILQNAHRTILEAVLLMMSRLVLNPYWSTSSKIGSLSSIGLIYPSFREIGLFIIKFVNSLIGTAECVTALVVLHAEKCTACTALAPSVIKTNGKVRAWPSFPQMHSARRPEGSITVV